VSYAETAGAMTSQPSTTFISSRVGSRPWPFC